MDIILTLLALFPSLLQSAGNSSSSQAALDNSAYEIQLENNDILKIKDLNEEEFKIVGLV